MKTHKQNRDFLKEKEEFNLIVDYLESINDETIEIISNNDINDWVEYDENEEQIGTNPLFVINTAKNSLFISFNHWKTHDFEVEQVKDSHFVDIYVTKLKSNTIINLIKLFLIK